MEEKQNNTTPPTEQELHQIFHAIVSGDMKRLKILSEEFKNRNFTRWKSTQTSGTFVHDNGMVPILYAILVDWLEGIQYLYELDPQAILKVDKFNRDAADIAMLSDDATIRSCVLILLDCTQP